MADKLTDQEREYRAERAKALLADPILCAAFEKCEADLMAEWLQTARDQGPRRETLWLEIGALRRVRDKLSTYVTDGRMLKKA